MFRFNCALALLVSSPVLAGHSEELSRYLENEILAVAATVNDPPAALATSNGDFMLRSFNLGLGLDVSFGIPDIGIDLSISPNLGFGFARPEGS